MVNEIESEPEVDAKEESWHVQGRAVTIDYTNYKGERAIRHIVPMRINYGKNQWHKEYHWILTAIDLDKNQIRAFSIKDIHSWTEGS